MSRVSISHVREIKQYHRISLRVPFRDVDSWGLIWHGHYFSFVDQARLELLKRFSISFSEFPKLGFVMPVVHAQINLRAPAKADELIHVDVAMIGGRGAMVETHFRVMAAETKNKKLADGFTKQVFTRTDGSLLYHMPKVVASEFAALHCFAMGE